MKVLFLSTRVPATDSVRCLQGHAALALAIVAASAAQAQSPLVPIEEVIVTADFRRNPLDSIAASISVLDAALMQQKNALHLEDVLLNAPNVNMAGGSSRARYVQLRGIGETGQFAEPLNSSVGMLIDGVDFSGIGAAAMLYDIEQVEILLGPQGTRYGSNALAGLINLGTNQAFCQNPRIMCSSFSRQAARHTTLLRFTAW